MIADISQSDCAVPIVVAGADEFFFFFRERRGHKRLRPQRTESGEAIPVSPERD